MTGLSRRTLTSLLARRLRAVRSIASGSHAVAAEEVAARLVQGDELEVDRRVELLAAEDRERVAAAGELRRVDEVQLVDEAGGQQRRVEVRAALADERAQAVLVARPPQALRHVRL